MTAEPNREQQGQEGAAGAAPSALPGREYTVADLHAWCDKMAALARELGHDPHPWRVELPEARTACRKCGLPLYVKVTASKLLVHEPNERCDAPAPTYGRAS